MGGLMARTTVDHAEATAVREAHRRMSPLQKLLKPPQAPRAAPREGSRLRLSVLADTVSTYLTLFSALLLPLLLILWGRSYMVNDRIYRADDGIAMVAGVANGEVAVWAGPTSADLNLYQHRSRQASWGQSSRRTFQRFAPRDHMWFAGFGYARSQQIPWREVTLTGRGFAVCIPLWVPAILVGALPFRLLARNMQSSEEFLAEREAENARATAA
jgi:hypothetical protein